MSNYSMREISIECSLFVLQCNENKSNHLKISSSFSFEKVKQRKKFFPLIPSNATRYKSCSIVPKLMYWFFVDNWSESNADWFSERISIDHNLAKQIFNGTNVSVLMFEHERQRSLYRYEFCSTNASYFECVWRAMHCDCNEQFVHCRSVRSAVRWNQNWRKSVDKQQEDSVEIRWVLSNVDRLLWPLEQTRQTKEEQFSSNIEAFWFVSSLTKNSHRWIYRVEKTDSFNNLVLDRGISVLTCCRKSHKFQH